ncbi:HipA domain-containing protein, partial [Paenarthrobacter sp. RAF9]
LEDGTQVLGLPPASKYGVASEDVAAALARMCKAPVVASRNLYLQFLFAWLTGNGDLHAKNLAILGGPAGFAMAPVYDVPCTLLYGDETLALPVAGKTRNLKARHWAEFAVTLGLPRRAAESANRTALAAADAIRLEDLPFSGSPLRGAQRELRFRRQEINA